MPITAKPRSKPAADPAAAFVEAAPDATPRRRGAPTRASKKQQITFVLRPELVGRLDAECERRGISRSAMIALAISQFLEQGLRLSVEN